MFLGTVEKQPAESLDYDVDYSDWLTAGDSAASAVATISSVDNTLELVSISTTANRAKVWLAAGASGASYKITVTMTTTDGRIRQDEFRLRVQEI